MASVVIGLVLLVVFELTGQDRPALEWRAGASWLVPWLVGLTIISWLGDYGGGTGLLHFGTAIPVVLVFSVIVYAIAYAVRLDPASVKAHVEASSHEAAVEDAELGV